MFGIDEGDGAAIVARDVVADADRDQLHRRVALDLADHLAQVALEIVAGIDRKRRIIDRRAVGNHHQDAALLATRKQTAVRPDKRLAIDILFEDAFAQHEAEACARAAMAHPPPCR